MKLQPTKWNPVRHILRALPVIAALAAGPGVAGAAQSPGCGFVAFAPQSDNGAFRIVAHQATCHTARTVASGSRSSRFRSGDPLYSSLGFSCSGRSEQLDGNGMEVVVFRCWHEHSLVSFLRG
jgi:hypothetical protein